MLRASYYQHHLLREWSGKGSCGSTVVGRGAGGGGYGGKGEGGGKGGGVGGGESNTAAKMTRF
jgi:hypothetical protein